MSTVAPPIQRPPLPPPPKHKSSPNGAPRTFTLGRIADSDAHRIVIYGTGGIGKTSLACRLGKIRGPVGFIDLDDSLPRLKHKLTDIDIRPANGIERWQDLRDAINAPIWSEVKTLVIDTATRAEEMASNWVLDNVPHEKGHKISRMEDYGFGKGVTHLFDTFLCLFGDLDAHVRAGRNVILICHDITSTVPNPTGEDFLRWEPRLQHPNSQKSSIRLKCKEWSDHLLYVGYDLVVDKNGVAQGSGSRTIYTSERPWCMAKSRTIADTVVYEEGSHAFWELMFAPVGS